MHLTHRLLGFAIAVGLASAISACSSDDGKPSGSSSGTVPVADAGDDGSTGGEAGTKKPNAAACAVADECQSGFCFVGGNQSFCTVKCTPETATSLCVPPFTGSCNKQGYCKRD